MPLYKHIRTNVLNGRGQYLAGYFEAVDRPRWRKPGDDCDAWIPEAEFLRLFGPEVQQ